jgi:hypothetical protein
MTTTTTKDTNGVTDTRRLIEHGHQLFIRLAYVDDRIEYIEETINSVIRERERAPCILVSRVFAE